jgi:hypothetical protein
MVIKINKMKKIKLILVLLLVTYTASFCQADKDFNAVVTFNKGFRFSTTGTIYTSLPSATIADWNTIINKPLTFAPAAHNHDILYKPITYIPTWTEVTGKPESVQLVDAILSLQGIKLPVLTTVQINALTPTVGLLVYDSTLNVLKIYVGTWKIIITAN